MTKRRDILDKFCKWADKNKVTVKENMDIKMYLEYKIIVEVIRQMRNHDFDEFEDHTEDDAKYDDKKDKAK